MQDAVIVSAVRTPVGKAPNGTLRGTRPDELAATVIAIFLIPVTFYIVEKLSHRMSRSRKTELITEKEPA